MKLGAATQPLPSGDVKPGAATEPLPSGGVKLGAATQPLPSGDVKPGAATQPLPSGDVTPGAAALRLADLEERVEVARVARSDAIHGPFQLPHLDELYESTREGALRGGSPRDVPRAVQAQEGQ
ncbi:MAG: hypothetical protein ACYCWW_10090 [Deltaproteobacteria bacterium]